MAIKRLDDLDATPLPPSRPDHTREQILTLARDLLDDARAHFAYDTITSIRDRAAKGIATPPMLTALQNIERSLREARPQGRRYEGFDRRR